MPRLAHGARDRERRVLLAERAVGADREQALARALATGADGDVGGRLADVDEPAAEAVGRGLAARASRASRACMPETMSRPASSASTRLGIQLGFSDAAGIGDADHQRARARGVRLARRQPRQARGDRRLGHGELADAELARPVAQAEGGLRVAGLGGVAEEQQIGRRQGDDERRRTGAWGACITDCGHGSRPGRPSEPQAEREAERARPDHGDARGAVREGTRRLEVGDAMLVAEVLHVQLERPFVPQHPGRAGRWSCSYRAHAAGGGVGEVDAVAKRGSPLARVGDQGADIGRRRRRIRSTRSRR